MAMDRGREPPKAIQDAPYLRMGLELFWGAFWDLHPSRSSGFDVGPIKWSDIRMYCQALSFDDEQTDATHFLISKMDQAYLEWMATKKGS